MCFEVGAVSYIENLASKGGYGMKIDKEKASRATVRGVLGGIACSVGANILAPTLGEKELRSGDSMHQMATRCDAITAMLQLQRVLKLRPFGVQPRLMHRNS